MSAQPQALRLADAADDADLWQTAAELRRLHQHELANIEWVEKTHWVQASAESCELGKHRADVIKNRIDILQAQRDQLLEAVQAAQKFIGSMPVKVEPYKDGYKLTESPAPITRLLSVLDTAIAACQPQPTVAHLPADDTEGGAA